MQTGRADLDAALKVSTIPGDEPVFILRAQDSEAADAVRDWAARHLAAGGSMAVAEAALQQADAMDRWSTKKLPGDDHWKDAERLQLEYQFAQRAWRGRQDTADLRLRLAEFRALAHARAELQSLLLSEDGAEILGMPNFRCGPIARVFQLTGESIPNRSEAEQAYVLAWLVGLLVTHGPRWRRVMRREIERRVAMIRAAEAEKAMASA